MTDFDPSTGEVRSDPFELGPDGIRAYEREVLRSIGLDFPDPNDRIHARLVNAIRDVGPGRFRGQYLEAMRFVFSWALREAGETYARSKASFEHKVARRVTELMVEDRGDGKRMTLGWAQKVAEVDAQQEYLAYLLAEKREQWARKTLDTIASAMDNHRTERADARAADRAHAGGLTGGA